MQPYGNSSITILATLLLASGVAAQTFEAVEIHPTKRPSIGAASSIPGWELVVPQGVQPLTPYVFGTTQRFAAEGYKLRFYLSLALNAQPGYIEGKLPEDGWDLSATTGRKVSISDERAMLLHVLQAEFGLQVTQGSKLDGACVAQQAPGGWKVKPSDRQDDPYNPTYLSEPGSFTLTIELRNATVDQIAENVRRVIGSACSFPFVSELPGSSVKYDLRIKYVNRDRAARLGKEPEAGPGPEQALKDQVGVVVVEKKRPVPAWQVAWSGKLPK